MIKRLVLLAILAVVGEARAYEQATHAAITEAAYVLSDLGIADAATIPPLVRTLGLDGFAPLGDGRRYFEFIGSPAGLAPFERATQQYEQGILRSLDVVPGADPLLTWLMYGAIREDDNASEDPATPQDVAPGVRRPLNHFFDPYFNRPLTAPALLLIDSDVHKNPDWAIGARDSFLDPNTPESPRRNSFSVFDAREAMFRALTLMTSNGSEFIDLSAGLDQARRQQARQAYWATAFRALGDVLHLNQDMAQPQHTRNEPHSGALCPSAHICLTGHTSVYEKYLNARAIPQARFFVGAPFNAFVATVAVPLPFDPYPIPAFTKLTDYWSTAPGVQSATGKGLADYSNRGFFTAGNNLGSTGYPMPSSRPSDYAIRTIAPVRWDGTPTIDQTPSYVYFGTVSDTFTQASASNVPLTSYGLWDQFLVSSAHPAAYTLNRVHYDAMAKLLLPRAAAYSAGLVNFFFRGRLDISLPDEGAYAVTDHSTDAGFTVVRAKITNLTAPFVDSTGTPQAQRMSDGQFFAVVRYHQDRKYAKSLDSVVGVAPCNEPLAVVGQDPAGSTECRDGIERIIVSHPLYGMSLDSGEQKLAEFDFRDSPIPLDMTDVVLQIVYRGELGQEADAVAVGTVDVTEPAYFMYQNASDYIHLGEHVYTRGQIDGDPDLLAQVQPTFCVDRQQSPPHLRLQCLNPFELDLIVSFGDLANPIAKVIGLPNRRFIRFAYLGDVDESTGTPVAKKRVRPIRIEARRHAADEKALLDQDGTCLPHDPFDIGPRRSQLVADSPNHYIYHLGSFGRLRGVNGWYNVACVIDGDASTPGTPDDRKDVMTSLTPLTEEVVPYPTTIMPDYL